MSSSGILYLNSGTKMLPRLITSLCSLRKHYTGNVTVISMDNPAAKCLYSMADEYNVDILDIDSDLNMRRNYWFEKSRLHLYTPYDKSIFIDSDTIIVNSFNELFYEIEEHDFIACQFSHWRSNGRTIGKRLKQWISTDKELVEHTIKANIPSVNVGVYGFKSDAELMKHWFDITIKHPKAHLPEETTCHLLLTQYKSKIVSSKYNCSCKHDDPTTPDTKIIHYHGRKHCLLDKDQKPKYNADQWLGVWLDVFNNNICDVQNWYNQCGDRALNHCMRKMSYA